jgi:hypothetical protein
MRNFSLKIPIALSLGIIYVGKQQWYHINARRKFSAQFLIMDAWLAN